MRARGQVRGAVSSLILLLSLGSGLLAQQNPALLDAERIVSGEFDAQHFGPVRWLDGSHYATVEPGRGALELVRYEAVSGKREVLVAGARLRKPGQAAAPDRGIRVLVRRQAGAAVQRQRAGLAPEHARGVLGAGAVGH